MSSGAIQPVTVTNARGTAAGWTVTGYVTDLGTAGSPTVTPLPGVTIPFCDRSGPGANQGNYTGTSYDRRCIPGDNLAWGPSSPITHDIIAGDVAQVFSGPAHATERSRLAGPARSPPAVPASTAWVASSSRTSSARRRPLTAVARSGATPRCSSAFRPPRPPAPTPVGSS